MRERFLQKGFFALYDLSWRVALPLLSRNRRLAEGWEERTLQRPLPKGIDLWMQAASAGEAYLAAQVLDHLNPRGILKALVTTNTRQGMEIMRRAASSLSEREKIQVHLAYCPFDRPRWMEQVIRQTGTRALVLLESEIWPGLLRAAKGQKIPILIANGRMTEQSCRRYRIYPGLWRSLSPDAVLAISEEDAGRFRGLFPDAAVSAIPNIKFDAVTIAHREKGDSTGSGPPLFPEDAPFLVFGSVREPEEADVGKMIGHILHKVPNAVIGLFPRHMHRIGAWKKLLSEKDLPWILRSGTQGSVSPGTVILWDTFGELTRAYAAAQAAFVGGSLAPLGGQNFLEPLAYGIVPVIGPWWDNFFWVGQEIIDQGLLMVVRDWREGADALAQQLRQPQQLDSLRKSALHYIRSRQGGTERVCRTIGNLLENGNGGIEET